MAKNNRGGKRTANTTPILQVQPKKEDSQDTQTQALSGYDAFAKLSDDDKADAITKSIKAGVPDHLSDSDFQKFLYNNQINDKPEVVDDATLDSMTGKEIFRTVNSVYSRQTDISYTANQIANQIIAGRYTRTSDSGGSAYGRGIYFADNRRDSTAYGNVKNDITKTAVIRAKLNKNANVIDYWKATFGVSNEISRGTKLGQALKRSDSASQVSIYAMAKGYNVISNGTGYYTILNRNALTVSKDVTAM